MGEGTTRLVNSFIVYKDTRSIFTSRDSGVTPCKGTQCDAWRVVGGVADPYTLDVLAIKGNAQLMNALIPCGVSRRPAQAGRAGDHGQCSTQ